MSASSSIAGTCRGEPANLTIHEPHVFFGGDAAFGPKNIITAVAQGHEAAISIDRLCQGSSARPPSPHVNLVSQKMGIHEWGYDNEIPSTSATRSRKSRRKRRSEDVRVEVELGFDRELAWHEAQRCLNCDVRPSSRDRCASSATPASTSARWTASPSPRTGRSRNFADASGARDQSHQDLYVSQALKTGRIMVKDEDVCLHCGLCAERCPTGAWDMQKFLLETTMAGPDSRCR